MALNYIFVAFFLLAFIVASIKAFVMGDLTVFPAIVQSTFDMARVSVDIIIGLIGVMTLWMGIMRIGELAGAVRGLGKLIGPFFQELFPGIPKDHPAHGNMLMNISANMLGLDNAATPLGLKAMKDLQEVNTDETQASNAMIMFLVLNTSGLTVVPVSVMAIRAANGAANPADIFLPILFATFAASMVGLLTVCAIQRINILKPVLLGYLIGATVLVLGVGYSLLQLPEDLLETVSSFAASFVIFGIITTFIALAAYKKINVYDAFIDGAKDGFKTCIQIIPYLVGMLVAIGVFRASGALDVLQDGLRYVAGLVMERTEWVDAMPTAFMKPLSGSGARGAMVEAFTNFGVDDFRSKLAATFQGSTETTFYTLAVYYGVVKIKNTRYTVGAGLLADLAGIVTAIFIAYAFFG